VLVWATRWLHPQLPGSTRFGVKRLIRDVFGIGGLLRLNAHGQVTALVLNQANRLSPWLLASLQTLLASADVTVRLGET
jgi:hypothetical protein